MAATNCARICVATGAGGFREFPRPRHRLIGIGAAGQRLRDQSHAFRPSESGQNGAEPGRARNGHGRPPLRSGSTPSRGRDGTPENADPSGPAFPLPGKAARGAGFDNRRRHHDRDPPSNRSSTAVVLEELQLLRLAPLHQRTRSPPLAGSRRHSHRRRRHLRRALLDAVRHAVGARLEDLLWSTTNLFHRTAERTGRDLDTNEQAQKRSQREQDGSEVRSVELRP